MSNFHIGQVVVALVDGHKIKKGDIATVLAIQPATCKCGGYMYDIGDRLGFLDLMTGCTICHQPALEYIRTDIVRWHQSEIAPLQTKSEEEDMNDAIEEALSQPAFQ